MGFQKVLGVLLGWCGAGSAEMAEGRCWEGKRPPSVVSRHVEGAALRQPPERAGVSCTRAAAPLRRCVFLLPWACGPTVASCFAGEQFVPVDLAHLVSIVLKLKTGVDENDSCLILSSSPKTSWWTRVQPSPLLNWLTSEMLSNSTRPTTSTSSWGTPNLQPPKSSWGTRSP